MSENSSIEWTDNTFNPWMGCTKVSPGCDHCYAEKLAHRFGTKWGADATRREFGPSHWAEPLRWNRRAEREGRRIRVFCASMADVFDNDAPDGARDELFQMIQATPNLDWLLLTKRIGNAAKMLPADWGDGYANVMLGATIVNQFEADRDIPKLLQTPARGRFLSCEPLLGPIDLEYPETLYGTDGPRMCCDGRECGCMGQPIDPPLIYGLNWVIVGGESGPQARPMHPDWAMTLRDQCKAARVPFFFKQWGEWGPAIHAESGAPGRYALAPRHGTSIVTGIDHYPRAFNSFGSHVLERRGKKNTGDLLGGVRHHYFPKRA